MSDNPTGDDLAPLIAVIEEATAAFIAGDMRRYVALIPHADDYTLMSPFGGDTIRGFDPTEDVLNELEQFFKGGEGAFELVQTYASGDLAVVVGVERQHGDVGDRPRQDWSLRVTLVFRHEGSEWRLAHRHADALVHPITFDRLSELARG